MPAMKTATDRGAGAVPAARPASPRRRSPRCPRLGRGLAVVVALLLALSGATPSRDGFAAVPAAGQADLALAPRGAPAPPALSAQAAYVFDASVGTELYALEPDEPRSPASLTKVATALVVLERAGLDEMVEVVPEDQVDLTESHVGVDGLQVGDRLSVRDLLAGLLIPSGNDAARALARHVGGGLLGGDAAPEAAVDAFVAEMNRMAAEMGLANTQFTNPSGIDDPGDHYASARDLGLLTARAMENETFAEIVATPSGLLPSEVVPGGYQINTTNDLLIEGVADGVKTGTTADAGGCLITATEIGGNRVIAVVLGSETQFDEFGVPKSPARFADVRQILAAAEEDYRWFDPTAGDAVEGLADELAVWETALPAGPALVVPSERAPDLRYRLQLGPPTEPDQPVGKVLFFVGSDFLSERPVLQAA